METADGVVSALHEIFPSVAVEELHIVVQQLGADINACFEHVSAIMERTGGKLVSSTGDLRVVEDLDEKKSEEEAKSFAMAVWLEHQESLLRKAQEETDAQSLIAALEMQDQMELEKRKEAEREEQATLQMLEEERLQRQADLELRTYECAICAMDYSIEDFYTLDGCDHRVCVSCMQRYVEAKISERDIKDIPCPMGSNCQEVVSFNQIMHFLPIDLFKKYDTMLLQVTLESDPSCRFCPRPGCGTAMLGNPDRPRMNCPRDGCRFAYCFNCREAWHDGVTCEAYQEWKIDNANVDNTFTTWANQNAKPCPNCHVIIDKNGGCNHMKCTRCQTDFCWQCGLAYVNGGHRCAGQPVPRPRRRDYYESD